MRFCLLNKMLIGLVESPVSDFSSPRAGSSSPFTSPTSIHSFESCTSQETLYSSLIKYVPRSNHFGGDTQQLLFDFYANGICPGRTVATRSNPYMSLLQIANNCESTKYALLSLSASYIREHLPSQKERFHQVELYYATQALQSLVQQINNGENYDAALATAMLLMHHAAINKPEEYSLCWSCHANVFDHIPAEFISRHSEPAQFMRTQLALARTAQTSFALQNTQLHSLENQNWFEGISTSEASQVCDITGISPQLLFVISSINNLATEKNSLDKFKYAQILETKVQNLRQWSPEQPGDSQDIILATGEAFRLATIIYLRCRLYG
jgi:hypothetical protein